MTEKQYVPPMVYAIWVDAQPDGPLSGQSGFLYEGGCLLHFSPREYAERKMQDMKNLCLNRNPSVTYQCVEYPGGYDTGQRIQADLIKAQELRLDPIPMRYEITGRNYGNTGGGCMVGTLAVRLTDLDKTVWVNCDAEGVTITSADYMWNEDHSGSWDRYEDVVMFEVNFQEDSPEALWPLLPAIQEAIAYTIGQEIARSSRPFSIPAKWLPGVYRQKVDSEYLAWALAENREISIDRRGVIPDAAFQAGDQAHGPSQSAVVYVASPLSGEVEQNLQFARQACRYAIAQGAIPFAPHLLYTQMLDDSNPEERQLGIEMGNQMLRLCDELWLCGDRISPGMAGERKLAESLGIPVRSISMEEILSTDFSPTKGMGMSMG